MTKDGQKLIVEAAGRLVGNEQGRPDYILIINTDITEQKRTEEHLLRAQRMESIGTLAGGIAHDLNNILSPILMAVDMMQLNGRGCGNGAMAVDDPRKCRARCGTRQTGVDICTRPRRRASFRPGQAYHQGSCHVLSETLPKSITLKYDIAPDLWVVSADPTQIHQVLMNICINARDAMPNGGTLRISAQNMHIDENYARMNPEAEAGGYVLVTIEDTGIGCPRRPGTDLRSIFHDKRDRPRDRARACDGNDHREKPWRFHERLQRARQRE